MGFLSDYCSFISIWCIKACTCLVANVLCNGFMDNITGLPVAQVSWWVEQVEPLAPALGGMAFTRCLTILFAKRQCVWLPRGY
mmetsp:Transcript_15463/g.32591  ORF Transcript_15463/g.32591 Transcript_15463/m.32591 type:complete len:83 (-) Transcript_15463:1257-1505(-)